jgi:hypothetical protein
MPCKSNHKTFANVTLKRGALLGLLLVLVIMTACQRKPDQTEITPAPELTVAAPTEAPAPTSRPPVDFWTLPAEALLIQGSLAYMAAGEEGLHLFDMTEPDRPTAVAHFDRDVWDLFSHENSLYATGCRRQCVHIFDLTNDASLSLKESFEPALTGPIRAMTVQRETLYLALEGGFIIAADMARQPWQIVHTRQLPAEIAGLDSQYDFLYVTVPELGVYLFDAADPAELREQYVHPAPKPAWHEEAAGVVYQIVASDEIVYAAAGSRGLRAWHHSVESENRQTVTFWPYDPFYHVRGQATAVNWQSPLLYVTSWDEKTEGYYLTVLRYLLDDLGSYNPINLIDEYLIGEDDPGKTVVWNGRVYFINQGVTQFQLPAGYQELTGSHPISPTITGPPASELQFIRQIGGDNFSLALHQNIAYVSLGRILFIYDVTDPVNPVEVNTLLFSEKINEVKTHNGYAYLRMGYLLALDLSDPVNPVEVARIDGFVQDIEFQGDYAYLIAGYYYFSTTLLVWNIVNPANIQTLGSFSISPGETVAEYDRYRVFDMAVEGDAVYVAWSGYDSRTHTERMGGLLLLDISDKENPMASNVISLGAAITGVMAVGDTVFGVDGYGQLVVFDVSDPKNPHYISILEADLTGLQKQQLVLVGDELWVTDGRHGLRRFDLTDLTWIVEKPGYRTEAAAKQFVIQDELIYLVSDGAGLEILRKEADDHLALLTAGLTISNAADIVFNEQFAYIADSERGLIVWDITDPLNPIKIGAAIQGAQYPQQLTIIADKLYARSVNISESEGYSNSLHTVDLFDISQPMTPTYQVTLPFIGGSFAIYDNRAYVTTDNQLTIWDMTNPQAPELLGAYEAPGELIGRAAAFGDIIYLSVWGNILLVLDASDITDIQPVYSIVEAQGLRPVIFGSWDLQAVGGRLYSICDWSGLCLYDISDPAQPVFLDALFFMVYDFEVIGDRVYILRALSPGIDVLEFEAYDLSDLTHIRQVSDFPDELRFAHSWPIGLAANDAVIYVALGANGLLIFERQP